MKNYKKYNSIVNFYNNTIKKYGTTNKGLAWESKKKNDLRYFSIFKVINKKKISKINILDFGCGISGIYDFLKKKNYLSIILGLILLKKLSISVRKNIKKISTLELTF